MLPGAFYIPKKVFACIIHVVTLLFAIQSSVLYKSKA